MANGYGSSSTQSSTQSSSTSTATSGRIGVENQISNLTINTSDMPTATTQRSFRVVGGKGAQFQIIILQNPSSSSDHTLYYDWNIRAFESGHSDLNNNLIVSLPGSVYSNSINFPAGGGEFVIKLIATNGTTIQNSKSNIITKVISKASANTTVTFAPRSATTNYATQPTATSVGAVNSTDTVEFNWDVTNISNATHGFGLRLTDLSYKKITDKYWYFETTENVVANGSGTDGADTTTVTVASTADLCVGMELTYYKTTTAPENNAGSAVGLTTIRSIGTAADSSGNFTITFSQRVGFDEGQTMTFRAYGSTYIKAAIGLDMQVTPYPVVIGTTLTKTVRANVSASTSVTLTDTLGLTGGNFVKYKGLGVNNASANAVTSVTEDFDGSGTDGVAVVQLAQTLSAGTKLTFTGCHKVINFTGSLKVYQLPTADKDVYLDLDKLITVGTAS